MKKHIVLATAVAGMAFTITACGSSGPSEDEGAATTTQTTASSTTPETSTTAPADTEEPISEETSPSETVEMPAVAPEAPPAQPEAVAPAQQPEIYEPPAADYSPPGVYGTQGAPQAEPPTMLNKTIDHCATDPNLYQRGTTFFTDGTTGWTQECASQMGG
ncbi:hypothetical protein V5S96_10995 [Corynebacterium mastitidis]|uniref:Secreted protein n=1 Tax=Corynebacterium mastitidis TaxID=161890 RepID=A0ABU8P0S9_9CORY